jgi:hypothetical protein
VADGSLPWSDGRRGSRCKISNNKPLGTVTADVYATVLERSNKEYIGICPAKTSSLLYPATGFVFGTRVLPRWLERR